MGAFKQFLAEMKFEDSLGKTFKQFHDKYKTKQYKDKMLYVNFSNYADNTLDKRAVENPDHSDPMGVYGYPLKYVIDHPGDILYGRSAKYLRVLSIQKGRILSLQSMSDSDMNHMYNKIFRAYDGPDMETAVKYLKLYNNLQNNKSAWFQAMQLTPESLVELVRWFNGRKKMNNPKPELTTLSAKEQTARFTSLGYSIIMDTGSSHKKAVINDREPEQIIFLNRGAFKIEEVYMLRGTDVTNQIITSTSSAHEQEITRKIAAKIVDGIGDKLLSSGAHTANMNGYQFYYTKQGQRVGVMLAATQKRDDLKFGQKYHKEFRKSTGEEVHVKIEGKRNVTAGFDIDESVENIVSAVVDMYNQASDNESFKPIYSEKEFTDNQTAERLKKAIEKKAAAFTSYGLGKLNEQFANVCEDFGQSVISFDSVEAAMKGYSDFRYVCSYFKLYDDGEWKQKIRAGVSSAIMDLTSKVYDQYQRWDEKAKRRFNQTITLGSSYASAPGQDVIELPYLLHSYISDGTLPVTK